MHTQQLLALGALCAAALSTSAHGQATPAAAPATAPAATSSQVQPGPGGPAKDLRASRLIGKKVRNARGEHLGEIADLMVDLPQQRVHYAVLAAGGFLGIRQKLFAYPVAQLRTVGSEDELMLDVDKQRLQQAPGFDRDRWPDWADGRYRAEVDRHHGVPPATGTAQGQRLVRASELIGKDIDDATGRDAGEIEDLVVNLATGRVRYAVLDFDKAWSPQDRLIALPISAIGLPDDLDEDLQLNVARDRIDLSTAFDEDQWPDLNDPAHVRNIERALNPADASGRTPVQDSPERMPGAAANPP